MNVNKPIDQTTRDAYRQYTLTDTKRNSRVACALVVVLMPPGYLMDIHVYPELAGYFFKLRLLTSAGAFLVYLALGRTGWSETQYRILCAGWYLIPAFFISWMIYAGGGVVSSYYAGLNLVILAVSSVTQATLMESIVAVFTILTMYISACFLGASSADWKWVANNSFFMLCTVAIVVTGNFFYNRLRFGEFSLRKQLQVNNLTLDQRNRELADAYQKLTEQESQIVQSQKMASVGQMSAGIIHEINNPLNFATTGLFTLRKKSKHLPAEQRAEYDDIVKDIEDGIGRVKNIVSDLRTFTHPNTDSLDQVVVADAVTSALRFLSNEVKDKAIIEQRLPAGQTVLANKNKLIHLFVNLIQNSLDALRSKGFPNGEQPTIWIEGRVQNGNSYLIVRDNGTGIPIDQVDKIYDPFFTTKAVGEGMGLGLSMCARIMKDSQGKISVRTEKGKFCEFTLEFPAQT